jgi:C1A family cysteine protease
MRRNFGYRPDLMDARDHRYAAPRSILRALPKSVDLRPNCPPVIDQGSIGSCVGCAVRSAFAFVSRRQGQIFDPSALFVYYNARLIDGAEGWDAGAYIRDGIKAINLYGACSLKTWPYRVGKVTSKPVVKAYREAEEHQTLAYSRVDNTDVNQIKARLAEGFPVVFGFTVYESFERIGANGKMPMPKPSETPLGGHAVLAVGYDDKSERVLCLNSWGKRWGDAGYFTMPYEFISSTDYADDFWAIAEVEQE